jgi:hypothetical protein
MVAAANAMSVFTCADFRPAAGESSSSSAETSRDIGGCYSLHSPRLMRFMKSPSPLDREKAPRRANEGIFIYLILITWQLLGKR